LCGGKLPIADTESCEVAVKIAHKALLAYERERQGKIRRREEETSMMRGRLDEHRKVRKSRTSYHKRRSKTGNKRGKGKPTFKKVQTQQGNWGKSERPAKIIPGVPNLKISKAMG